VHSAVVKQEQAIESVAHTRKAKHLIDLADGGIIARDANSFTINPEAKSTCLFPLLMQTL
jgi:hypothetical protein